MDRRSVDVILYDRDERPIQVSKSAGVIVICILLLCMGAVVLHQFRDIFHRTVDTEIAANHTLQTIEFNQYYAFGDCPNTAGCDVLSSVMTFNGTMYTSGSVTEFEVLIGQIDGYCITTILEPAIDDLNNWWSNCLVSYTFNGANDIPSGSVEVQGPFFQTTSQSTYPYLLTQWGVVGGTGNYTGIIAGSMYWAADSSPTFVPVKLNLDMLDM